MSDPDTRRLIAVFRACADAIEAEKDRLSALDGVIGDADHGITMSIGFTAVTAALADIDPAEKMPTDVFNLAAKTFLGAVGASAGPLYATAFMRAGAVAKGRAVLDRDAWVDIIAAMVRGMQDRGKAERGEKTMIDAWLPAAEAAEAARSSGADLAACLAAAAKAAREGADATKDLIASKGRSSRLGERALGHIDPGAESAAIIMAAIAAATG